MIVKTSGQMTGYDYVRMAKEILKNQKWRPNNNILFDHRELSFDYVPFADLQVIRQYHKKNEETIGHGKSAIVLKHGNRRNWEKLWERGDKIQTASIVKIFEEIETALRWAST
jgi:hypothetical protein